MYEGSYHPTGRYTKLTIQWNITSRITFNVLLENFDLMVYKLNVLREINCSVVDLSVMGKWKYKKKLYGNKSIQE